MRFLFEYMYPWNMLDPLMGALEAGINMSFTLSNIRGANALFQYFRDRHVIHVVVE